MKHSCQHIGKLGNYRAQIPIRITEQLKEAAAYRIKYVDANTGYQGQQKFNAAKRWEEAALANQYVWLGISGAATPVGLGGLVSDLISQGLIDVVVSTGANVFHDLHFACGLPVRHGKHVDDDDALAGQQITRIYTQYIHSTYTLKAQDAINQHFARRALERLEPPFSSAELLNALGKEMLEDKSGLVVDKKGSFVLRAAEHGVPVYLDSTSNHSLGMDMLVLFLEGKKPSPDASRDLLEATALSYNLQPQLNVFLGEGGPRNFAQTLGPTASEIFYLKFEGADSCIRFTTADERAGALSGSTPGEAVTWGKYPDADPKRDISIWGEYTLTFPDVAAYVAKHRNKSKRLFDKRDELTNKFLHEIKAHESDRLREQKKIFDAIPKIQRHEIAARKKEGYLFD